MFRILFINSLIFIIFMLRITNLLRGRIPKRMPARAGLPNWDRPDPPPSARVPVDHELTDQQILLTFQDGSMPEHVLTQPQVYEGDTLLQASPSFIKGWSLFLAFAGFVGTVVYFTNPLKKQTHVDLFTLDRIEKDKQAVSSKQWLKWGNQNPMGMKLQGFPYTKSENLNGSNELYSGAKSAHQTYSKINKQVQSYLRGVKQRAQKKVRDRLLGHHDHSHDAHSHDAHHHESHSHDGHNQHHNEDHNQHTQSNKEQANIDSKQH